MAPKGNLRMRRKTTDHRSILPATAKLSARFWGYVERRGPDECWPWTLSTLPSGYGIMVWGRDGRRLAHRVAYALDTGVDPGRAVVRHRCDNPICCNPRHLRTGTQGDNVRDAASQGHMGKCRGSAHPWAKITETDVVAIRAAYAQGMAKKALARQYGVSATTIRHVVQGKLWRHVA